jgi:excisionase family DNA binding protein
MMIESMEHRERLLTVQELAEYLGVPVATLYQWRHRREGPPGFRVGRHVRYRWIDVHEWIEQQLVATPEQSASHVTGTVADGVPIRISRGSRIGKE